MKGDSLRIGVFTLCAFIALGAWLLLQPKVQPDPAGIAAAQLQQQLQSLDLLRHLPSLQARLEAGERQTPQSLDEHFQGFLNLLTHRSGLVRLNAATALTDLYGERVAPYLIMALQFELAFSGGQSHIEALQRLSGKAFERQWRLWYQWWWGERAQLPPPGFSEWISTMYSGFIPSFAQVLAPDRARRIELHQVMWGQVALDEIEALNHPSIVSAEEALQTLLEDEMVFGVEINGETRAYPLRYLDVHELLNDTVGGRPILLSFCTLCGSAVLFDRELEGEVHSFGNSGLLFQGNKLMFDRTAYSLWSNIYGKPLIGPMSQEDVALNRYPLTQTTLAQWMALHPETGVLFIQPSELAQDPRFITGGVDQYEPGAAYSDYRQDDQALYPVIAQDDRLAAKDWVFGIVIGERSKAYAMAALSQKPVLNDFLGDTDLVLLTEAVPESSDLWKQGGAVRAYLRQGHTFRMDHDQLLDERNQVWELTEAALVNPSTQERLERVVGEKSYWFAWYEFYPKTLLHQE